MSDFMDRVNDSNAAEQRMLDRIVEARTFDLPRYDGTKATELGLSRIPIDMSGVVLTGQSFDPPLNWPKLGGSNV